MSARDDEPYDDYPRQPPRDGFGDEENGDYNQRLPPRDEPMLRERDRGDRERHHSSRDRERERDRGDRGERHRERDRDRGDRDRGGDRDRDRDRGRGGHRDREPRRSRDRSPTPSRSRSRDRSTRTRKSGFDQAPPGAIVAPAPVPASAPGAMPAFTAGGAMPIPGMPGMFPNMPNMFPFPGAGMMSGASILATRHARRVYVGGLPPMANEQGIAKFFSWAMEKIGGNTAGPGDAVVFVYINQEKRFAFVEMRTVEEASNAMALDGVVYEGVSVRVRRPSDYNPSMAATLGPSHPSPNLNLAAVGLTPGGGGGGGADGPDRIFVGGLPYYLTEDQIKELLSSFGPLRAFDLVKDRDTGNSKGYGFCVYQDPNLVDVACAALNGMKMGDKTLTVRRATASGQPKPEQGNVMMQAQQQLAFQMGLGGPAAGVPGLPGLLPGLAPFGAAAVATRVLCLDQVVQPQELVVDDEYEEIMEDMREECGKFGTVTNLVIPRPAPGGEVRAGVGKVFVEYTDRQGAEKAKQALHGRKFGGNPVVARFYDEAKFAQADYGG